MTAPIPLEGQDGTAPIDEAGEDELRRRVRKLERINHSLMRRIERSTELGSAYSLFHSAVGVDTLVRLRTEEVKSALIDLERWNDELSDARDASERANRIKTRFFTAVGHDLLQPVHAARLSVSALETCTSETDRTQIAQRIDHALSSIEDLLKTILDLSKLEAGVLQPSPRTIALSELFHSLQEDAIPIAKSKQLTIKVRPTDLSVHSDPLMLRRMLQNLLANAVRYTASGGILLAARRRGDCARIEIWDTGSGIPEEDRERIFEEFQRGSVQHEESTGVGLGLAIVQRMGQTLDHSVGLCSQVGKGTMFHITAPLAHAAETSLSRAVKSKPVKPFGFNGAGILVIDDDKNVLEAMQLLLNSWDCNVVTAQSIDDIEKIIAEGELEPRLVLADFHLRADETGLQVVRKLRARYGADLPAVIITADFSTQMSARAAKNSCEILRKPVKPAELRALMTHLIQSHRRLTLAGN